jgi:hypothetical protein
VLVEIPFVPGPLAEPRVPTLGLRLQVTAVLVAPVTSAVSVAVWFPCRLLDVVLSVTSTWACRAAAVRHSGATRRNLENHRLERTSIHLS